MLNALRSLVLLGALLLSCAAVWAGDCSGPSDCSSIPDNATKGAVIISVFAGVGLAVRSMSDPDDDSDFGSDSGPGDDQKDPAESSDETGESDATDDRALFGDGGAGGGQPPQS